MAFCPSCGTQVGESAGFCPSCGKPMAQAAPSATADAPSPASSGVGVSAAPLAENIAGMLAYFTIIPAIVFLLIEPYNRNRFIRFHSFQCLFTCGALLVIHVVLGIIGNILPLLVLPIYALLGLAELALWLLLVVKAYQHEMFKLPVVGDMAERQANAI